MIEKAGETMFPFFFLPNLIYIAYCELSFLNVNCFADLTVTNHLVMCEASEKKKKKKKGKNRLTSFAKSEQTNDRKERRSARKADFAKRSVCLSLFMQSLII